MSTNNTLYQQSGLLRVNKLYYNDDLTSGLSSLSQQTCQMQNFFISYFRRLLAPTQFFVLLLLQR